VPHNYAYHIDNFIHKYGNIKQFSCQGIILYKMLATFHNLSMEKNNDTCKHIYLIL